MTASHTLPDVPGIYEDVDGDRWRLLTPDSPWELEEIPGSGEFYQPEVDLDFPDDALRPQDYLPFRKLDAQ